MQTLIKTDGLIGWLEEMRGSYDEDFIKIKIIEDSFLGFLTIDETILIAKYDTQTEVGFILDRRKR